MQRLARWMVRYRVFLFLSCVLVTAIAFPISQHMKYDRSVRSFFDLDDPSLLKYIRAQAEFGGDTMCLAVYTDPELLTVEGLTRLDAFAREMARVPGILQVTSLAEMRSPLDPVSLTEVSGMLAKRRARNQNEGEVPLLAKRMAEAGARRDELRKAIIECSMYSDQFVSADGCTTGIVLLADPAAMGSGKFTETLAELRRIAARNSHRTHVVGAPVMINDVYDFLEQDSWVLANVSSLATMLVILVLFRRIRWTILPLLVVQVSLVWMRALMAIQEIQLSITSSLTTALITVIGIATSIHVAVRFQEECGHTNDRELALEHLLAKLIRPVFWTCATTALGFAALATSQVVPVRDFGIVMALAALSVGTAAALLMPAGILMGGFGVVPRKVPAEDKIVAALERSIQWVTQHSLRAAVLTLALLAVALYGFRWIDVETDFTRNFRDDSLVIKGYRFVEDRLGGAGFVELVFDVPGEPTADDLARIRRCEEKLRQLPGVTKVTGLCDLLEFFSPASSLASPTGTMLAGFQLKALRMVSLPEILQVWNAKENRMRMVLRVREQQTTEEKAVLLSVIEKNARETLGESATATGLYCLLVELIRGLLEDQWRALAVSALGILVMMTIAFRSLRLGLVAFLPNMIPMATVVGMMGWLGLKLNVATAMIQSISMGLAVDFSIHYLTRFLEERNAGADFYTALCRTHQSTGKAMVCSNLALMLGFGVLTFSNFLPTIHFGVLVSIAMLGGLVGSLVTLPVLLRLFYWVKDPPPSNLLLTLSERVQEELRRKHAESIVPGP